MVDTISKFAGVPISHYVEIDFDGFKAAVDALGGIDVDVPVTIDDDDAGGYVEAGQQTLNGDQALILCRSRHTYDEYGSGDYYRMANQRMVMGAIAKKILASDVVTMANTINAMARLHHDRYGRAIHRLCCDGDARHGCRRGYVFGDEPHHPDVCK